jgi:hypothetical protein
MLLDEAFNKTGDMKSLTHSQTLWEPVRFVFEVGVDKKDRYVLIYSDSSG